MSLEDLICPFKGIAEREKLKHSYDPSSYKGYSDMGCYECDGTSLKCNVYTKWVKNVGSRYQKNMCVKQNICDYKGFCEVLCQTPYNCRIYDILSDVDIKSLTSKK